MDGKPFRLTISPETVIRLRTQLERREADCEALAQEAAECCQTVVELADQLAQAGRLAAQLYQHYIPAATAEALMDTKCCGSREGMVRCLRELLEVLEVEIEND